MVQSLSEGELDCVLNLVRKAGSMALDHWPAGEKKLPFTEKKKNDGSPVTSIDVAVNTFLVDELSKHFPDDGFYSEELGKSDALNKAKRAWILDPIDGTQSFLDGQKEFGVLLALVENGSASLGIAFFPAYEKYLWALSGRGAFCNDTVLRVSQPERLCHASIYVRGGGIADEKYIYERELGTAHGFFFLCTGKVDALVVRISSHQEWDFCPFIPLVEESGGKITDESGAPIRFSFDAPRMSYLVAAHPCIHPSVMSLLS